ncbi:MAG TPA: hypothetical protein VGF86_13635 [Candidatus Tumulicola sp.]|jgi:hypothetical protein
MPDESLAALAAHVGAFRVTDRGLARAQSDVERALAEGTVDDRMRARFLSEVRRYFEAFGREAKTNLRDVDRRIVDVNQILFNLTAERGVAVKRIEAIEGIARELAAAEKVATP